MSRQIWRGIQYSILFNFSNLICKKPPPPKKKDKKKNYWFDKLALFSITKILLEEFQFDKSFILFYLRFF